MSADSPPVFGSDTVLPVPDRILPFENLEPAKSREEVAKSEFEKVPVPTGYRILIVPYTQPKMSKGGIQYADSTVRNEELATVIGNVLSIGPDAYKDKTKFPAGAWCKPGDYILFGRYAGAKILMDCGDNDSLPLRLLNDDEVLAIVRNPEDFVGVI